MATIGEVVTARVTTKANKTTAVNAAAIANQAVADTTTADNAQELVEAKGLLKIGPTVIGSVLYDSPDGVVVHETPVNGPDTTIPDDPAVPAAGTANPPTAGAPQASA